MKTKSFYLFGNLGFLTAYSIQFRMSNLKSVSALEFREVLNNILVKEFKIKRDNG